MDDVTLITRPRRFGKTLTMSMLEHFFSIRYENSVLFRNLKIWRETAYRKLQGQYPVISISFADVKERTYEQARKKIGETAIWSLLLASGYLKVENCEERQADSFAWKKVYQLRITNLETQIMFRNIVRGWFAFSASNYNEFIKALLADDVKAMNVYMNRVAKATFSYFDSGNHPSEESEPERFYHGFVLGLIVSLEDRYAISSNRESGFGRYNVLLEPKSKKTNMLFP